MDNIFKIRQEISSVIIEKGEKRFSVERGIDGDIWFNTSNDNLELIISSYSKEQEEWRSYVAFLV